MNDQYADAGAVTRIAGPVPRRWPSGLGRRPALAVGGAAAVVMLGGVVAVLSGHAPGSATADGGPALISVTGCSALAQVNGTLEQVTGGDLVVKTASGTVSVSTAAATGLPATLSQLQAGAPVIAVGHPGPGKTLSAIAVFQPPATPPGTHAGVIINYCSPTSAKHAILAPASAG